MISFDEIKQQAKEDLKIDVAEPGISSIISPEMVNKYSEIRAAEEIILRNLKRKYEELYLNKKEYYNGRSATPCPFTLLKTEIPDYLNADAELNDILDRIEMTKIIIKYVEEVIGSLRFRNNAIKNYIDWERFKAGS